MKHLIAISLIAVFALAGCSNKRTYDVASDSLGAGTAPANFSVSYDSVADTVTLSDGITDIVLAREPLYDIGKLRTYSGVANGVNFALVGETTSGTGYAGAISSPFNDFGVAGAEFGRTELTTIPRSGAADYVGRYGSWIVYGAELTAYYLISGDAALTADFGGNSVSGAITNRIDAVDPINTFADIILIDSSLINGGFSGAVTGGAGNGAVTTTLIDGSYAGMLTGPNGEEIVGAVFLEHDISGEPFFETGAFIAE